MTAAVELTRHEIAARTPGQVYRESIPHQSRFSMLRARFARKRLLMLPAPSVIEEAGR